VAVLLVARQAAVRLPSLTFPQAFRFAVIGPSRGATAARAGFAALAGFAASTRVASASPGCMVGAGGWALLAIPIAYALVVYLARGA
jgi:hypothetical protein